MPDTQDITRQTVDPTLGPMNFNAPTQPAQPQASPNQNLSAGLGLNFGDVMRQIAPFVSGGAPTKLYEQQAEAEGEALKAAQKQKIAEAEGVQKAATQYGGSAHQALQQYTASMAGEPLPAFVPTQETASDIGMLGGLLAIVGFMTGKGKGMQSGLAAMDSMTGMLKGWQQGRKDLYERELTNFKANFERVAAAHREYIQQLQNALTVSKVDLTKGMADAQVAAAKAGDAVVLAQAKAGKIKGVIDAMNAQSNALNKATEIAAKLYTTEAANVPLDPDTMNYWADRIRAGDPMPALGFGAQALRKELLQKVAQDARATGSNGAVDQANSQIRKANTEALGQLSKAQAMISAYENTAINSSYIVDNLAKKGLGPSGSPVVNRWVQAGRQSIVGDPDVTALNQAIQTLMSEYAKVMSGGYGAAQPSVEATERAQKIMSVATNWPTLQKQIALMKSEMAGRSHEMVLERQRIIKELQSPGIVLSTAPPTSAVQTPGGISDEIAHPTTQAEFDALPSGAEYIDPDDGKKYRKP